MFGVKYLLINAPQKFLDNPVDKREVNPDLWKEARGEGYEPGVIFRPSYQAARDMWVIDDVRMKQLAQFGIENNRLTMLHDSAREALIEARQHLENLDYEGFMNASRRHGDWRRGGIPK